MPDGTWTLQEYVMNPAKYGGRKFDMRVWAMITSTDPLRIVLIYLPISPYISLSLPRSRCASCSSATKPQPLVPSP